MTTNIKKSFAICLLMVFIPLATLIAQGYKSVTGEVAFFSSAPIEDIKADNKEATGLFNVSTGAMAFLVPIKGFRFRKSLMQQHFNERFMESDRYPEATFDGKLTGYTLSDNGVQNVVAEGNLTIHGISKSIREKGDLTYNAGEITMKAVFPVSLADFDIEIPQVLFYNIAEEVEVTVYFVFKEIN